MSSNPEIIRTHLRIRGVVQGVGFRFSARNRAVALGLSGWVRNDADGSVETEIEGSSDRVREFIAWARSGPPGALVDDVVTESQAPRGDHTFRITT
ncbi:MAG TPA: acylphosphatase [Chloroflexota bacterium]|nr:acylphosphatase [Chloroflexota bacterium]